LAGVSAIGASRRCSSQFHRHDRQAKSTSVTRAFDRALGRMALGVDDPMMRAAELFGGADWCMMV
jgi:hypothetical protein